MESALIQLGAGGYALLFLTALLGKLDAWRSWKAAVSNFFAGRLSRLVLFGIPCFEAVVVGLLVAAPVLGLWLSAIMLIAFGAAVFALNARHSGDVL